MTATTDSSLTLTQTHKSLYWVVWSPRSRRPPYFRHTSLDSAAAEAERLAALNPGRHFYVLQCVGFVMNGDEVGTRSAAS
jgi:hypothetical protein